MRARLGAVLAAAALGGAYWLVAGSAGREPCPICLPPADFGPTLADGPEAFPVVELIDVAAEFTRPPARPTMCFDEPPLARPEVAEELLPAEPIPSPRPGTALD